MKATRKLIPAIAMLLISAVMMSTATFAWFSTNSNVSATGFNVTVKADSAFLVISEKAEDVDGKAISVNIKEGVTGLLSPSRPLAESETKVNANFAGQSTIAWSQGTSNDSSLSRDEVDYEAISVGEETGNFVVYKKLYIRSAAGFPDAKNLVLSGVKVGSTSPFAKAVSVVIKCNGKYFNYINGTTDVGNAYVLDDTVTDEADTEVEIYIYVNGDHDDVKTTNATTENLVNMTVELTFSTGLDASNPADPEGT